MGLILISIIAIILLVYLGLMALLYFKQASYIYKQLETIEFTPDQIDLEYQDIYFTTKDNLKLHGWYLPKKNARSHILFCHGNAGTVSHLVETFKIFNQLGFSTFVFDYRGYGHSEGSPNEEGTYQDACAALHYLIHQLNIPLQEIIIAGRSLGGAIACRTAAHNQPKAVIIESSFSCIVDMAKRRFPIIPVDFLIKNHYPSKQNITQINAPILIVHSSQDEVIPFEMGQKLFDLANEPKQFLEISGDHDNGYYQSGTIYLDGLDNFFKQLGI